MDRAGAAAFSVVYYKYPLQPAMNRGQFQYPYPLLETGLANLYQY